MEMITIVDRQNNGEKSSVAYANLSVVSIPDISCGYQSEKLAFGSDPSRIHAIISHLRWRHKARLCVCFMIVIILASLQPALSEHGSWHDHYTDALGINCCSTRDCIRTVGRLLERNGDRTQVEVQGVPLWMSAASVHNSEDGAFWVCIKHALDGKQPLRSEDIRCVFVAIGS